VNFVSYHLPQIEYEVGGGVKMRAEVRTAELRIYLPMSQSAEVRLAAGECLFSSHFNRNKHDEKEEEEKVYFVGVKSPIIDEIRFTKNPETSPTFDGKLFK
jgi:hypothetical protein